VLKILRSRPATAGELAAALPIARPAAEGLLMLSAGKPTDRLRAQELGFRSLARDEYATAVDS
jgi:hypothetical protein